MNLLCKLGIHLMKNHRGAFVDTVSGKMVYYAECPCGREWLVDTLSSIALFKAERVKR